MTFGARNAWESGLITARIAWSGVLIGQVLVSVMGLRFIQPSAGQPNPAFLTLLGAMGVALLAAAYYVRSGPQAISGPDPGIPPCVEARRLPPRVVAGFACGEAVVFLGLIARALGCSMAITLLIVASSIVAVLIQYPRSEDSAVMGGDDHVA